MNSRPIPLTISAVFTFSTQVGDDSWKVVRCVKNCTPETTLREIIEWTRGKAITSAVCLEIIETE